MVGRARAHVADEAVKIVRQHTHTHSPSVESVYTLNITLVSARRAHPCVHGVNTEWLSVCACVCTRFCAVELLMQQRRHSWTYTITTTSNDVISFECAYACACVCVCATVTIGTILRLMGVRVCTCGCARGHPIRTTGRFIESAVCARSSRFMGA